MRDDVPVEIEVDLEHDLTPEERGQLAFRGALVPWRGWILLALLLGVGSLGYGAWLLWADTAAALPFVVAAVAMGFLLWLGRLARLKRLEALDEGEGGVMRFLADPDGITIESGEVRAWRCWCQVEGVHAVRKLVDLDLGEGTTLPVSLAGLGRQEAVEAVVGALRRWQGSWQQRAPRVEEPLQASKGELLIDLEPFATNLQALQARPPRSTWGSWVAILGGGLIGWGLYGGAWWLLALGAVLVLWQALPVILEVVAPPQDHGHRDGGLLLLAPDSVTVTGPGRTSRLPWRMVQGFETRDGHTLLFLAPTKALVVPHEALGEDADVAMGRARGWWELGQTEETAPASPASPARDNPFAAPGA